MNMNKMCHDLQKILSDDRYYVFLRERANRCCCKYCGGELEIRRLTYSNCDIVRLELYCNSCERIEFGIEKILFQKATYFIEETGFDYYPDVYDGNQKQQMNTAKVCEIIGWMFKDMGWLNDAGFIKEMPEIKEICSNSSIYEGDMMLRGRDYGKEIE